MAVIGSDASRDRTGNKGDDTVNVPKFKKFLTDSGAVVLDPTNEWELVRFRTSNGVSVIYENKKGQQTFTNEAGKAFDAFDEGKKWKAVNRKRRTLRAKKAVLATRDGRKCFFDGQPYELDDLTIEHLLNVSHGGTDHMSNLALACDDCNTAVGNMAITQKMAYRDKMLKKYTAKREIEATLKLVLMAFNNQYQVHISLMGVRRETPVTAFHTIINNMLKYGIDPLSETGAKNV